MYLTLKWKKRGCARRNPYVSCRWNPKNPMALLYSNEFIIVKVSAQYRRVRVGVISPPLVRRAILCTHTYANTWLLIARLARLGLKLKRVAKRKRARCILSALILPLHHYFCPLARRGHWLRGWAALLQQQLYVQGFETCGSGLYLTPRISLSLVRSLALSLYLYSSFFQQLSGFHPLNSLLFSLSFSRTLSYGMDRG